MNNKLIGFIAFSVGAAVGSVVTWKLINDKCNRRADEEIESVKATFSKRKEKEDEARQEQEKYEELVNGYISTEVYVDENHEPEAFKLETKEEGGPDRVVDDRPYVISPDEFGDFSDYEMVYLSYYADGILADEDDEMIDHVDMNIGLDSLERMGEYEDDIVHVRNDRQKIDYEITRDLRRFSDVKYAEYQATRE